MTNWYEPRENLDVKYQPFVSDSHELNGMDEWDFRKGEVITDWNQSGWIACTDPEAQGTIEDVVRNHLGIPIFSKRVQTALNKAGVNCIQYLPIKLKNVDGTEIEGYAIANFLSLVSALDTAHSDFDVFDEDYFLPERRGKISAVRRFVLRSEVLSNLDAVRLKEFPIAEFVSEFIVRIFINCGFTGWVFSQINISSGSPT